MFKPTSTNINLFEMETALISYWKENKIFEKSVSNRPEDKTWTFLDGPPFITGMPHYGTLLPSILKDIYPRFWTMKGYRVERVWGWDCHGLPAENKVETKLGIKRKKDIEEKVGIKKFIDECKLYVNEVSSEWEWYIDHIARWVDFKNAYRTMDKNYMETVMWVFKQMYDGGHIYKGMRVSLYCPHCSTPISNFEVAMDADNYKTITEASNTYKYPLADETKTYLLAWSTTPWNKIVTPALAVNPNLEYVKVKEGDEYYILAKSTLKMLKFENPEIVSEFSGSELVGKKFTPHYDFYKIEEGKRAFVVIPGDFVSADEGTGIVTIAAYGEEDLAAMKRENIQIYLHVDEEGKLKPEVPHWAGMYYLDTNPFVNADLQSRGLLYNETSITHSVATCWRCHTRLYYAPQDAWYVNVQDLKPLLEQTNADVNWFPDHFKNGRFLNSLKSAPDWCISRSRYWGSPVPVWECECGWRFVPGSIKELSDKAGVEVTELHRPEIDQVTVSCDKCGKSVHRIPEVLDSWIEAGSASFAERHYPFEHATDLDKFFPPDFIVEYTGQIRAWFYVLHVISGAIFKKHAFKNVGVTGVILGTDGRKMSKNFGNYPDPKETLSKYGGDALRLYMAGHVVTQGEDMVLSEDDYKLQVRSTLLTLWNTYNFFVMYANIDKANPVENTTSSNVLDRWLFALTNKLNNELTASLEKYDSVAAVEKLKKYIEEFSTWYIRRSRDRVGPAADDTQSKQGFYDTCFWALKNLCLVAAPIIPFMTEEIYKGLTTEQSVHLGNWPELKTLTQQDLQLIEDMKKVRKIVELGLSSRKEKAIKVRQPLRRVTVNSHKLDSQLETLILDELNIKEIVWAKSSDEMSIELDLNIDESLVAEGQVRELARQVQELRKQSSARLDQKVIINSPFVPTDPKLMDLLKRNTLAKEVIHSETLTVTLCPDSELTGGS